MIDVYNYIFETPLYQKVELQSDDKILEFRNYMYKTLKLMPTILA